MAKPRVKVLHDSCGGIREVRVILGESTSDTRTFDEYGGVVIVRADASSGKVSSFSLDCQKLAGREYERMLIELMSYMKDWKNKDTVRPRGMRLAIDKCLHAIDDDRLEKVKKRLMAERKAEFGSLDLLIEACANNKKGDISEAKIKTLSQWMMRRRPSDNYKHMDELFEVCFEDNSNNWIYGNIVSEVLKLFPADFFDAYVKHRLNQGHFNNQHWRTFVNVLADAGGAITFQGIQNMQHLYELMAEVHPEEEKDQKNLARSKKNVLDNIHMLSEHVEEASWDELHKWLTEQMKDEPNEDTKLYLKVIDDDVSAWMKDDGDDGDDGDEKKWAAFEGDTDMVEDAGLSELLADGAQNETQPWDDVDFNEELHKEIDDAVLKELKLMDEQK